MAPLMFEYDQLKDSAHLNATEKERLEHLRAQLYSWAKKTFGEDSPFTAEYSSKQSSTKLQPSHPRARVSAPRRPGENTMATTIPKQGKNTMGPIAPDQSEVGHGDAGKSSLAGDFLSTLGSLFGH